MFEKYPDVAFDWKVHELSSQSVPMQQIHPEWELKIVEGVIENADEVLDDLTELVHRQEDRLVKHTKAGYTGGTMLDRHHLTTRFQNWNLFYLDDPAVEVLWEFFKEGQERYLEAYDLTIPGDSSIQSWANVLRSGDEIGKHSHVPSSTGADCYLSMNFCVTADETTATVYDLPGYVDREASFTNHPGQLICFPPWVPHYTTPFKREDSTRITIASDIDARHWVPNSYEDGERRRHFIPFDKPPRAKRREHGEIDSWEEIPSVDTTIARLVNYEGDLTEETLVEMKEGGTEFANRKLVPEGLRLDKIE